MPQYKIDRIETRDSAGGPSAIEITAYLTDVLTGTKAVTVTNLDKVDITGPTVIGVALTDANEDIDLDL